MRDLGRRLAKLEEGRAAHPAPAVIPNLDPEARARAHADLTRFMHTKPDTWPAEALAAFARVFPDLDLGEPEARTAPPA